MIDFSSISAFPLSWPVTWPRTKTRFASKFRARSMSMAITTTLAELSRMGVPDWEVIVSSNVSLRRDGLPYSNQRRPDDPGVAVYFKLKKTPHVLACDRWPTPEENLWAIAKHIEALRGQDRWGVGTLEQAFTGYAALPAHTDPEWWAVLEMEPNATVEEIKTQYRRHALFHRPDLHTGGPTPPAWVRIQAAYEKAKAVRGFA